VDSLGKKSGLKPEIRRGRWRGYYMIGRGRRWRVNCFGEFECSCPLPDFDRWANSVGAAIEFPPKTESEFIASVIRLVFLTKLDKE